MARRCFSALLGVLVAIAGLAWGVDQAFAQTAPPEKKTLAERKGFSPAEIKAAAKRAAKLGLRPGLAGQTGSGVLAPQAAGTGGAVGAAFAPLPGIEGPGGVPHYFGPYGNWAYSPLPRGPVAEVTPVDGGTGYTGIPTVTIDDAYTTSCQTDPTPPCYTPAIVTATRTGGVITRFTVVNGGDGYTAPVVTISGGGGTGALADAVIGGALTGGMLKFVDKIPGLGPTGANALGQYIPVAVAESVTVSGQAADYYEIALVEFTERMHSALPPTRLRGYVQLDTPGLAGTGIPLSNPDGSPILMPGGAQARGVDRPHSLGPVIVAKGRVHGVAGAAGAPKPVRIKFYNLLPGGAAGDLFIPVDETVPGSGAGPVTGTKYTQNRATIHLHGNNTVWISDGNTHQWITPATESTPYPKGVSVRNVPDMGTDCDAANSGCLTFFYTNAQSARLQFYHDHAMGITRLNVYAGEAAGYVLTDAVDQDMINGTNVSGVNPNNLQVLPGIGIPLVIQDRTWVDADTVFAQDPTWNWGTGPRVNGKITAAVTGDLWFPHVYLSAQNPWDLGGVNAVGRWHYGPWFNPPTPECVNGGPVGCIERGPVPNEYHQPICVTNPASPSCTAPWEPPLRPGVPNPSIPGEAFMDTPTVNGTAYPYIEVEPKAYRFRVLSAANDRFFNLQLYVAADKNSWTPGTGPAAPGTPTALCDGVAPIPVGRCTEVKMVSVAGAPNQYSDWPSGIPDPATAGPPWILLGTEGGFRQAPLVVPQQPIGWNLNPTMFNFGTVNQHSLLLGSAERADVVVDFSAYAGKTLILYNDAPAAFPAGVPTYDYYTGVANQMDAGGAPMTQPGYGPNTRTVMQIRVGTAVTTPTTDVTLANLQAVFAKTASKRGVFEVSQEPIIIPQAAYNSAYNNTFTSTAAGQYIQIADTQKTFQPIDENGVLQTTVTLPLQMKAMHDEMGGVYDTLFGRMSGMLGLSLQNSPNHVLVPYGYAAPPTDLVKGSVEGTPIGVMPDGTQIWRIFHNGVDTHTIHTHLFHAQVVNRLGQDGAQMQVDPIDQGWKDTFRVNPLEVTYLAMRPTVPTSAQLPFAVPNSVRLIDPTLPEGTPLIPPPPAGWFDPAGNLIPQILNHYVDFGWEYVWHCHILAHEEMDMMHSLVFAMPPTAPSLLSAVASGGNAALTWTDNSLNADGFTIQRATDSNFTAGLTTLSASFAPCTNPAGCVRTYVDPGVVGASFYRVSAANTVGDTATPGFPTMAADSAWSNTATFIPGGFSLAAMTSPTPGTTLTGTSVTFNWNAGTGATAYSLWVGTTLGGSNIHSYFGTATSSLVGSLPNTGVPVYVRLWTQLPAGWFSIDYTYTALNARAAMTSPTPGTVLTGTSVTFNWNAATGALNYSLWVGTTLGGSNIHSYFGTATSSLVGSLPNTGVPVYVRLWTELSTGWFYTDYTYTALNARAAMTSPTPGTVLTGTSVTFNWNAATGALNYSLWVGTTLGGSNIHSYFGTATSSLVSVPSGGVPVYVRLWTELSTGWFYTDYTYTAAP